MKFSTFILLLILVGLGYMIWTDYRKPEGTVSLPSPQRPTATTTAAPTRVYRDDLVPISGRVVSVNGGVVRVNCPAPSLPPKPDFTGPMWRVDATDGNQDSKNLVKLARAQQAKYDAAVEAASAKISGIVLVWGHPQAQTLRPGMPVQMVAAPLGRQNFTMAYEIVPDPPGSWMRRSKTALDRKPAH